MPSHVITVIHGTWARNAKWVTKSNLFYYLQGMNDDVVIRQFNWSGGNTFTSRLVAAEALSEYLKTTLLEYPSARHYVIAHSHGGNVLLYALNRMPDLVTALSGIVFLSTPFLMVDDRDLGESQTSLTSLRAGCLGGIIISILLGLGFGQAYLLGAAISVANAIVVGIIATRAKRVVMQLKIPESLPVPALIVRAHSDEASGGLVASQFLAWTLAFLWRIAGAAMNAATVWAWRTMRRHVVWLVSSVVAGIVIITSLSQGSLQSQRELWPVGIAYILALGCLLPTMTLLFCVIMAAAVWSCLILLALPMYCLLFLLLWPFGPEVALVSLFVEASAESAPPGIWQILQLGPKRRLLPPAGIFRSLRHATYHEPAVAEAVVKWIRDRDAILRAAARRKSRVRGTAG